MSTLCVNAAAEVEEQHRLAQLHAAAAKSSAVTAIDHARRAGALLLDVKATLQHGECLPWLAANVSFTARTAQRYMNAAAPKPKCDRLSHSSSRSRPPKPGSKKARVLAELNVWRHREDVLAHAAYLASELPVAKGLQPADLAALTRLRDRLNEMLGASA